MPVSSVSIQYAIGRDIVLTIAESVRAIDEFVAP